MHTNLPQSEHAAVAVMAMLAGQLTAPSAPPCKTREPRHRPAPQFKAVRSAAPARPQAFPAFTVRPKARASSLRKVRFESV